MNDTVRFEELPIPFHKIGRSKPLGRLLHLRVGERKPYLAHFAFGKEPFDDFNVRAQECHILHSGLQRLRCPRPHTGSFNIYRNKVLFRKHLPQTDRIFSPSTAQFEHNRMIVLEKLLVPISLHVKRHVIYCRIRIFEHVRVTRHIGKLL